MPGDPLVVAGILTNRNTGHRYDQKIAELNHGAGIIVEIGFNPIVGNANGPVFPLESYLQRNGLSENDFPGRKLFLVPSESVGLEHVHFDDPEIPVAKPKRVQH